MYVYGWGECGLFLGSANVKNLFYLVATIALLVWLTPTIIAALMLLLIAAG